MHFGMGFPPGRGKGGGQGEESEMDQWRVRARSLGVTISGAISRHALSYALTKRRAPLSHTARFS